MSKKQIVIAVGGSGGHLLPAQALAEDLTRDLPDRELLFAGAHLGTSRYFDQTKYPYRDVRSATVFCHNRKALFQAIWTLVRGVRESFQILNEVKPELVVGFGSFHSFSILLAACIKRIPFVLFESNAIPGKVNRLFSFFARFTAIHFSDARLFLKGAVVEVKIPIRKFQHISGAEARVHFRLFPDRPTLLIFGGSQGSSTINNLFIQVAEKMKREEMCFQVIHLTGKVDTSQVIAAQYQQMGIPAYVCDFESRMDICYQAATLAIARAGAITLSELVAFEVPSILIPYPFSADNHQTKNAEFLARRVQGASYFEETELTQDILYREVKVLLDPSSCKGESYKQALHTFKSQETKGELCRLICTMINR